VRAIATRLSDAIPDAYLQLSGGLDRRLFLAALPAERRRRHRVVTIGGSASPDVRIARAITSRLDLRHEVIDTGSVERLGAQELHDTLQAAVHGYDFASNPIDKVSLMLANRQMGGGGCFNGQNGEILRGFYFPGQPLARRPDEALAQGLIRMRLEANDRVDPSLFPPERYRESRSRAEARAVRRLVSLGATWSDALDRFYLYERMQRWAGNGLSNFLSDRVYLCPFLDPDFVTASLAVPARARSNSRAAFELLAALDPELAAIPLDSGLRPSLVVEAPLRAQLAEAGYIVDKAVARLKRSLKGGGRATLGSATVAQLWHRHRLFERLPGDSLLATGLFEPTALDALLTGRLLPDRPTLGFLLMMAELVRRE
jgi:asparagine synthase (glutamine-hydrolysing)